MNQSVKEIQENQIYQEMINALIPAAEEEADRRARQHLYPYCIKEGGDGLFKFDYWTMFFHRAMNRMAKQNGLRCCNDPQV